MIRKLNVERFKSLFKLEVELGLINVFIGANGSGKSNILESLGVLGAAAYGRVDDETLQRRGVRPGVPRLYKSAFPQTRKEGFPHIHFTIESHERAWYEVTLWNPLEDPKPAWQFKTESLYRGPKDCVISRSTTSHKNLNKEQGLAALKTVDLNTGDAALTLMDQLRNYSIYSPNTPTLRGLVQDMQTREPVGLSGGRLPEAVGEFRKSEKNTHILEEVRELIDWAKDFSAASSIDVPLSPSAARYRYVVQFIDKYMAEGRNKLTGYDASEGALYILFCSMLALHSRSPQCLAVDNVDQALNPRLAMRLMTALCKWTLEASVRRQWLITAHNPAILDGLPLDNDGIRLFAVDRNSNGHTSVRRIDLTEAKAKRPNTEWTLSRMWINGLIGGVPNV